GIELKQQLQRGPKTIQKKHAAPESRRHCEKKRPAARAGRRKPHVELRDKKNGTESALHIRSKLLCVWKEELLVKEFVVADDLLTTLGHQPLGEGVGQVETDMGVL